MPKREHPTRAEIETLQSLDAFPYLQDIIDHVRQNDVSIIDLPTGYGKTRGVPPSLAWSGMRVMIAIPKVASAVKNYNDLANDFPSLSMNKRIGGEGTYENTDDIVFVTYGHLKNELVKIVRSGKCRENNLTDVLIMDEAHTPELDVLLCMALWKFCYNSGVKFGKLILMSATIKEFSFFPDASIFTVTSAVSTYKKTDLYHDFTPLHGTPEDIEELNKLMADQALRFFDAGIGGDILIFVGGLSDIDQIKVYLADNDNIKVFGFISSNISEQRHVVELTKTLPHPNGIKYVIVATESAEESLTLPTLDVVIDSLLHKQCRVDDLGFGKLVLEFVSQASATQRRGRVGRMRDGISYRMCTREDYDNLLDAKEHDVFSKNMDDLNLSIYNMGLNPFELLADQPNVNIIEEKIIKSTQRLENIHLIKYSEDRYITTPAGRYVIQTHSSFYRLGYLKYLFNFYGKNDNRILKLGYIVYELLEILMTDKSSEIFSYPDQHGMTGKEYTQKKNGWHSKYHTIFFGDDDIDGYINLWNYYIRYGREDDSLLRDKYISRNVFDSIYNSMEAKIPDIKPEEFVINKGFMHVIHKIIIMSFFNYVSIPIKKDDSGNIIYNILYEDKNFTIDKNAMHNNKKLENKPIIPFKVVSKARGNVCTLMMTINKDVLEWFIDPANEAPKDLVENHPSKKGMDEKFKFLIENYNIIDYNSQASSNKKYTNLNSVRQPKFVTGKTIDLEDLVNSKK